MENKLADLEAKTPDRGNKIADLEAKLVDRGHQLTSHDSLTLGQAT